MGRAARCRATFHFIVATLSVIGIAVSTAHAAEVLVQNDSLTAGDTGNIQAGFVAGESAGAWLTSPCDGNIVAVQVFWRSTSGTTGQSFEDSIKIYDAGPFPTPGALLATIAGPVVNDGVFNEFRFLDENQVIPLNVPITNGQTFVVSFTFLDTPNPADGPSLVSDFSGCQAGKNTIDEITAGWFTACFFGVSGDWVIRAVVDCASGGPGSIPNGGDVPGAPLLVNRVTGGQLMLTWGDSCSTSDDDYEVYEGFMGAYYSHFAKFCSTGNTTTTTFAPDMFDRYYLVVPTDGSREGSYGRDGNGDERPQGGGACWIQPALACP